MVDEYGRGGFDDVVDGEGFDGEAEVVQVAFVVGDEGDYGVSFQGFDVILEGLEVSSCGRGMFGGSLWGFFGYCKEENEGGGDEEEKGAWWRF